MFFDVLGRILQIFRKKYSFLRSLRFFENENFAAYALSGVCANNFFFYKWSQTQVNLIHETPAYGKIKKSTKSLHPSRHDRHGRYGRQKVW